MLRTPLRKCCYAKSVLASKKCPVTVRCQSTANSSSGSKVGVVVVGGTLVAVGGALAFAKYDMSFRSKLEDAVPYADKALGMIIGDKEPTVDPAKRPAVQAPSKPATKVEQSLLQKKLEREKQQIRSEPASSSAASKSTDQGAKPSSTSVLSPLPPPPMPNLEKPSEVKKAASKPASDDATNSQSNSPLVGNSSRTLARQEEMKKKAEKSFKDDAAQTTAPAETTQNRDQLKDDLREQLKLQLAAYTDYLKEQLHLQRQELNREHQVDLEEKLLQEKMRYQAELAASISRLQEIERVLHVREKLDAAEHKSRELWLVVQILNDALKSNPTDSVSTSPRSILKEIESVIAKVNESEPNSLSQLALKAIPKTALASGVYTEDALIARFDNVAKLAKRVSLIGDEGGSLWRYILSYVQSALIIDRATISKEELEDKVVDPSKWDTYAILARVRYHLRERNLEMSLRYANQLRGEPRKVASDWIKDVRTHLETRQSANILLAQAASVSIRTLNN